MNVNNNVNIQGNLSGIVGDVKAETLHLTIYGTNSSESQASSGLNPMGLTSSQGSDPIYIERPNLERLCCESIQKSPCLLRVAAPQQMGKTMLINYITSYAERELNYKTIKIDFRDPMLPTVSNNNNFSVLKGGVRNDIYS